MNLKRMLSALLVVAIMLCVSGLALAENAKISFVDDSAARLSWKSRWSAAVFNKMPSKSCALWARSTPWLASAPTQRRTPPIGQAGPDRHRGPEAIRAELRSHRGHESDAVILPRSSSWEEAIEAGALRHRRHRATGWENTGSRRRFIFWRPLSAWKKGRGIYQLCNAPLEQIREGLAGIPESERKTVYFENSGDYCTCLVGSGWNDMIVAGGGANLFGEIIFADEDSSRGSVHSFAVDPELILERNPDMISTMCIPPARMPEPASTSSWQRMKSDVLAESAGVPAGSVDAVQNKQVYGFSFTGNACFKIVASCSIAKWLYPDVFVNLIPTRFSMNG